MYTNEQKKIGDWVRSIAQTSPLGYKGFYQTVEWKHKRKSILDRDHRECIECAKHGKHSKASFVHHIKHLKDAPELALTDDNLESLCKPCHELMHPQEPEGFKNVEKW